MKQKQGKEIIYSLRIEDIIIESTGQWELLTGLNTYKIGRQLWMCQVPHLYDSPQGLKIITAAFLFDHASVPRLFTFVCPPVKSCLGEASLPHDDGYGNSDETDDREEVDIGLREITLKTAEMAPDHTDKFIAKAAYRAVRIGAGQYFNKEGYMDKFGMAYIPYQKIGFEATKKRLVESYELRKKDLYPHVEQRGLGV